MSNSLAEGLPNKPLSSLPLVWLVVVDHGRLVGVGHHLPAPAPAPEGPDKPIFLRVVPVAAPCTTTMVVVIRQLSRRLPALFMASRSAHGKPQPQTFLITTP